MTFRKDERLCSRTLTEKLFHKEGSRSMAAFPLRLVYMKTAAEEADSLPQVLISVPKRCFKRAVKRNRVKRQIREAYRKNKSLLAGPLEAAGKKGVIAFIWLDSKLHASSEVEEKVKKLLQLTAERMV